MTNENFRLETKLVRVKNRRKYLKKICEITRLLVKNRKNKVLGGIGSFEQQDLRSIARASDMHVDQ